MKFCVTGAVCDGGEEEIYAVLSSWFGDDNVLSTKLNITFALMGVVGTVSGFTGVCLEFFKYRRGRHW